MDIIVYFNNPQRIIDNIRDILCGCVSLYSFHTIYQYVVNNDATYMITNEILILGHCLTDIFLINDTNKNKVELYLHHLFACGIISFQLYNQPDTSIFYSMIFVSMECSTFFLVMRNWLDDSANWIKITNNILFILCFYQSRIYYYSRYLIFDKELSTILVPYTNNVINFMWYYLCIYGLYGLNLYWLLIMIKIGFKQIKNMQIFSAINCETILEYSYCSSLLYSFYAYSACKQISLSNIFILDIIGQTILVYSSKNYHKELKNRLIEEAPNTNIDVLKDQEIMWNYLNDIWSIHIRTFLCLLTNLNIFDVNENMTNKCVLALFSFYIHMITYYDYLRFIVNLKIEGKKFGLEEPLSYKSYMINFLIGTPILLDNIIIICNTNYYNIRVGLVVIFMILVLVSYVRPAYQANHLLIHIVLLFQTIYLTNSNIFAIMNS